MSELENICKKLQISNIEHNIFPGRVLVLLPILSIREDLKMKLAHEKQTKQGNIKKIEINHFCEFTFEYM